MKTLNRNLYTFFVLGAIGWTSAFGAEVNSARSSGEVVNNCGTSANLWRDALFFAFVKGEKPGMLLLKYIFQGGDVNAITDKEGRTCLHYATLHNFKIEAELLLLAGADKNSKTSGGKTPSDIARNNNYGSLLNMLTSDSSYELLAREIRNIPTAIAAGKNEKNVFENLGSMLDPKSDCLKNYKFRSFFIIQAILLKSEDIALEIIKKLIFKAGININSEDAISSALGKKSIGDLVLDFAICKGRAEVAQFIGENLSR
ncbi:MAG: hypothetical protein WCT20_00085 [Candidatus Babeliales bacterium]